MAVPFKGFCFDPMVLQSVGSGESINRNLVSMNQLLVARLTHITTTTMTFPNKILFPWPTDVNYFI